MNRARGAMSRREGAMHLGKKTFVSGCFFRVAKSMWPQTTTIAPDCPDRAGRLESWQRDYDAHLNC
jgi:hypothetical protein